MLGEYQVEGIEAIESAERRALVEHRVPGMEGSYLQDLGSVPNAITIAGTRHGDDARDAFLEAVRGMFETGEPTTFTADINTATDLTDVVIEDLQVAEVAGEPDSFRYMMRLRRYVEPPEPAAAGLAGLDTGLLDAAQSLAAAMDALDALGSVPNIGDPTPPLRGALDGVRGATSDLQPAAADAQAGLTPAAAAGDSLPPSEELQSSLDGARGSADDGTGAAGALAALERADADGRRTELLGQLDAGVAGVAPEAGAGPGSDATAQIAAVTEATPDPTALAAPLAEPISQITAITGPEAVGAIPAAVESLSQIGVAPGDGTGPSAFAGFEEAALAGPVGGLRDWSRGITELVAALQAPTPELVRDALFAYLHDHAAELGASIAPGGGPVATLASALETGASSDSVAAVRQSAADLATAMDSIRADASAGGAPSAEHLTAAESAMQTLTTEAPALATRVGAAAQLPAATPEGLTAALTAIHASLEGVEVVDLADIPDAFADGFRELQTAIESLDLASLRAAAEGPLREVSDALADLDLSTLGEGLDAAQAEVESALDTLDGAAVEVIAQIRAAFASVRDALTSVTGALGETGEDGRFHFHAEGELHDLLDGARAVIHDDVLPALTEFRTAIETAVGEVNAALEGVTDEVQAALDQLRTTIEEATAQLESVDVTAVATDLVERLGQAIDGLGEIDFDTVVDPVVAQIDGLRDELRRIDPAALNDLLRAALAAAAAALQAIDFPGDITAVLMTELDELLQVPIESIGDLQEQVDAAVARFADLNPETLAAPLAGVFTPALDALDAISVEQLAAPVTEWYEGARTTLEGIMPEALLQPLVDAHDQLSATVTSISADAVVDELEQSLASVTTELQRLEPSALVGGLTEQLGHARSFVETLDPATLTEPLAAQFDNVSGLLTEVDPATLLAPLGELSDVLAAPLGNLTQGDAERAAAELEPLRTAAAGCDPVTAFAGAAAATTSAAERLGSLELETTLARVRSARTQALEATTDPAATTRIQALDPLGDDVLNQALTDLRTARTTLASAFTAALDPPADLAAGYARVQPVVDALVPAWAQGTPTVEGLRAAFAWADPAAIAGGLTDVHSAVTEQWSALDPRTLTPGLTELRDQVVTALGAIDPQAIAARVDELVGGIGERLATLDLDGIRADAGSLTGEVTGLVDGLDPRPIIDDLSEIADEVRGLLDQLDPAALLADLNGPIDSAREILTAVDPAAIAAALEPAYQRIREILEGIDLAAVLAPLTTRIDTLRDELEAALKRTETSFRGLIGAIPH